MRDPPVAPRRRGRRDKGAGVRSRRVQVRLLPSTQASPLESGIKTRRSSTGKSAALRRRRPHVRVVPARPRRDGQGQGAGPSTRMPGFDSPPRFRCQVVERQDVRPLPGRRGFDPLPGSNRRPASSIEASGAIDDPMRWLGDTSSTAVPASGECSLKAGRVSAGVRPRPSGSRIVSLWSSFNGEDAGTPSRRSGFDSLRPHHHALPDE